MKKKIFISILILAIIILTGCVPGDKTSTLENPAGFFWGVWHGWLAPISLIVGFFNRDIRIYEVFNKGWTYDLGYYIAVISGFGSVALKRREKKKK